MMKLTIMRFLPVLCLIALTIISCDKNDDIINGGKVQLLSFGPTGAKHGDTLRFIGNNLTKVTSIQFAGGTSAVIDQKDFKTQTSELIKVIVPVAAEKGYVTLKTSDGDIITKTQLNLDVLTTVASMTLQARPGENITINGDYLNWVDRVTFNKNRIVATFVTKTKNQLVIKVPDSAQTGPLILHYGGTDSADVETKDTLKVALPVATTFSPNPVKHKTNLTITGTNLDLTKKIVFEGGDTVTSFVSVNATQLVVNVPSKTQKGKITLIPASGVNSVSAVDLDVVLPSATGMTPSPVAVGSDLTITGTNLDIVKSVSFVGVSTPVSSFVSQSPTQLVVTVPTGAAPGKLTLSVLNSTLIVKSATDLAIVGFAVPPIIIYDDAITSAWNGWIGGGWGGTKDLNNTTNVKSGTKSVKIDYTSGAYGVPLQLGGATIPLAGYTSLKVSIYGGTGSNGKNVNIGFNEADGKTVTLVEGQWNDFTIPLNQISSITTVTHLYIKNYSASGAFTIYVDDLGIY